MDFLNKVPRPVLVFAVFLIGVAAIFYLNRPHSICDSQAENLKELQRGNLYPKKIKGVMARPPYSKAIKECREGMGSPGACLEFFQILKRLSVDLDNMDASCGETINEELKQVRTALGEGILTMVQIGWGESVPPAEVKGFSWLQPPEYALFCSLTDHWTRFYGDEGLAKLQDNVFSQLSGKIYEGVADGKKVCKNCEKSPSAIGALGSKKEVFRRSLFAVNCNKFR